MDSKKADMMAAKRAGNLVVVMVAMLDFATVDRMAVSMVVCLVNSSAAH